MSARPPAQSSADLFHPSGVFTMPNVDTSKKFDSVEKYRIRKLLSELDDKTGRGKE